MCSCYHCMAFGIYLLSKLSLHYPPFGLFLISRGPPLSNSELICCCSLQSLTVLVVRLLSIADIGRFQRECMMATSREYPCVSLCFHWYQQPIQGIFIRGSIWCNLWICKQVSNTFNFYPLYSLFYF